MPLQIQQPPFIPGFHQLVDQRGGGEAHRHTPLIGGQAQAEGHMGLAGAAVADGDDVLAAPDVFAAGQFCHQGLVHRGDGGEVKGVQALHRGEPGGPDAPLHHALRRSMSSSSAKRSRYSGWSAFRRHTGRHLLVLPEKTGQPQLLRWCSNSSVDRWLMPPSLTEDSCSPWRTWC